MVLWEMEVGKMSFGESFFSGFILGYVYGIFRVLALRMFIEFGGLLFISRTLLFNFLFLGGLLALPLCNSSSFL